MWFVCLLQGARVWVREKEQLLPATVNSCGDGTLVVTTDYGEVWNAHFARPSFWSLLSSTLWWVSKSLIRTLHIQPCITPLIIDVKVKQLCRYIFSCADQCKLLVMMFHFPCPSFFLLLFLRLLLLIHIQNSSLDRWHTFCYQRKARIDRRHYGSVDENGQM